MTDLLSFLSFLYCKCSCVILVRGVVNSRQLIGILEKSAGNPREMAQISQICFAPLRSWFVTLCPGDGACVSASPAEGWNSSIAFLGRSTLIHNPHLSAQQVTAALTPPSTHTDTHTRRRLSVNQAAQEYISPALALHSDESFTCSLEGRFLPLAVKSCLDWEDNDDSLVHSGKSDTHRPVSELLWTLRMGWACVHCKNSHRNKKWFLLVCGICWSDWTSRLFGENGPSFPSTSSKMQSDLKAASRRTSESYRTKGFRYQTPHFWAAYITFHLWGIIHPAKCWSEKCHYVKRKKAETHHQTREARTCEGETTRWGRGG